METGLGKKESDSFIFIRNQQEKITEFLNKTKSNDDEISNYFIELKDEEFVALSKLIYEVAGIHLTDQKKVLMKGRLNKILKNRGYNSFQDYYNAVRNDSTGELLVELIDRISTNHTFFFREKAHFDYLKDSVFPEIVRNAKTSNQRTLRIWCAGSSSGEEAYTLGIVVKEFFGAEEKNWDIGILATDISMTVLEKAQTGIYSAERVEELSVELKNRYFNMLSNGSLQVKPAMKDMILFKRLNLMNETYPFKGKFDVIFCRNVMIYFDRESRNRLVNRLHDCTAKGGYLFVGHSEALARESCPYKYVLPAIYKKV